MKTILLTGGGTAGHVIPHVAIIDELKKHFDKIYYVGRDNSLEQNLVKDLDGVKFYAINTVKFERRICLDNFKIPFKLISAVREAKNLLKKLKPSVVFSKGGYVSLPIVLAAYKLKIPCVTHESDLSAGLTTKLIARKCKAVLTSFEETAHKFKNGVYTGSPIREQLFKWDRKSALKFFNFKGKKPVLLITGGSSGATKLNEIAFSARTTLLETFDIIHLVGKGKQDGVQLPGYFQAEYLTNMGDALNLADVVVSRGGANTLFELLALNKPSLIIPLPKGNSRGDQVLNARYFAEKKLVKTLLQENLTYQSLIYNVNELFKDRFTYIQNMKNYRLAKSNENVCKILVKEAN